MTHAWIACHWAIKDIWVLPSGQVSGSLQSAKLVDVATNNEVGYLEITQWVKDIWVLPSGQVSGSLQSAKLVDVATNIAVGYLEITQWVSYPWSDF